MESFYEPENEADVLNMKYSKNGEFLREYDYDAKLNNILKNGISTINEANLLSLISGANNIEAILESKNAFYKELGNAKNNIEKAKCLAESGDLSGYASLARATVVLDELTK